MCADLVGRPCMQQLAGQAVCLHGASSWVADVFLSGQPFFVPGPAVSWACAVLFLNAACQELHCPTHTAQAFRVA
jgi:hypothetical protein